MIRMDSLLSQRPFIDGQTVQQERMKVLQNFVHNPLLNCIFISKVHTLGLCGRHAQLVL